MFHASTLPNGTGIAYIATMTVRTACITHWKAQVACMLLTCAAIALPPQPALSNNDDDSFVISKTGKRFYALPAAGSADSSLMGVKVVAPAARRSALHSDVQAMRNGFMRMDRDKLAGPRRVVSHKEKPEEALAPQEADAVTLGLFDTEAAKRSVVSGIVDHRWPLPAGANQYVSSGYGMRNDPFDGKRRFHAGLDIAAPLGTSVLATADGRVKATGTRGGFGNYVTLAHADGSETMYSHLQKATVSEGRIVRAGQEIGKLGSTGRSTGPHLDFRLKVADQRRDPMTVLAGKAPVNIGKVSAQVASRAGTGNSPNVRNERGVRIITPRERIAMSNGFIRVR